MVNPHLLKDLTERALWNDDMKNQLIANNGSVQVMTQPTTPHFRFRGIVSTV
jgi:hypothetical protein